MAGAPSSPPAVVVTGASTGIGRALARRLARAGWCVWTGVRRDVDVQAIRAEAAALGARLEPLRLDVTDPVSLAKAAGEVERALDGRGLAGLVNNAGIVVAGPLECLPPEALDAQFRVNVLGVVWTTQAFLPLLRRARGRIVNVGSISGRLTIPLLGAYAASKHALEALSDAMRLELRPWGIAVALLEPGPVATPLWEKSRRTSEAIARAADPARTALYAPLIEAIGRAVARSEREAIDPDRVARAAEHALTARRPRTRYPLGPWVASRMLMRRWLPDRWVDALLRRALRIP